MPQTQPEQRQKVEQWLSAALARHAEVAVPLRALTAELFEVQGRYTDAIRSYRQCLESDSGNVLVLNNLAFLLAATEGRADEALTLINSAIEAAGPRAELLDTRAAVNLKRSQPDLAVKDSLQSIALDSRPAFYCRLALGYLTAKNRTAAEEAFRKAAGTTGLNATAFHPLDQVAFLQLQDALRAN